MATEFAITLSQALQDNHIINTVLINLPCFLSLLCNVQFTHSPKLMCYTWNWTLPRRLTVYNGKLETYRNNTEIRVIVSHFAVLKHYYGEISIWIFFYLEYITLALLQFWTGHPVFLNCSLSRHYHGSKVRKCVQHLKNYDHIQQDTHITVLSLG